MWTPKQPRIPAGQAGGGRWGGSGPGSGGGAASSGKSAATKMKGLSGQAQAAYLASLTPAQLAQLKAALGPGSPLALRVLVANEASRRSSHPGAVNAPTGKGGKGHKAGHKAAAHKGAGAAKRAAAHKLALQHAAARHQAAQQRAAARHQAVLQRAAARQHVAAQKAAARAAAKAAKAKAHQAAPKSTPVVTRPSGPPRPAVPKVKTTRSSTAAPTPSALVPQRYFL